MTNQPLTDHQLDEIEARAAALNTLGLPGGTWTASPRDEKSVLPPEMAHVVEDVLRTKHSLLRSSVGVFGDERHAEFIAHAPDDVPALLAEVRRLQAELAASQKQNESYRLQLNEMGSEYERAQARVLELERPAVEAKRNEIRQSFAELTAQAEQDRDHEGAFNVQSQLREREEQWKREDAAQPAV